MLLSDTFDLTGDVFSVPFDYSYDPPLSLMCFPRIRSGKKIKPYIVNVLGFRSEGLYCSLSNYGLFECSRSLTKPHKSNVYILNTAYVFEKMMEKSATL